MVWEMQWEVDFLTMLGNFHGTSVIIDNLMIFFSMLGNAGILWIGIGLVMLVPEKTRKWGFQMLCAMALTFIIGNLILKNLFHRTRPYFVHEELDAMRLVARPSEYSFPSGHTMNGITGALTMIFWDKRFGIPAMVVAVIISFSRLYNTVHYPTDVIAGVGIGVVSACIIQMVFRKIEKKNPAWLQKVSSKVYRKKASKEDKNA